MNIFWSDLNNIQEPGDYPFRDSTITVTFAEIAVWKATPDAQFELMRKHPIQEQIRYVLGKQVEKTGMPNTDLIYTSSNGDQWSLTKHPLSGVRAVMHQPNLPSGGRVSFVDLDSFLRESPQGPQHQALRQLIEGNARRPG